MLHNVISQDDKQIIMRALAFAAGMADSHGNAIGADDFRRMYNRLANEVYGPNAVHLPATGDDYRARV